MTVVENKWLTGPYAPIPGDVTATELVVEGTLPTELNGRYLRNGPNPITPVDPATHHWFVGDGMVHGVRLREGQAEWYRARMVRSTGVSEALGEEPVPGERHGGMETANTNVIGVGGKTLAIVEAGARPVELTYDLDTVCHTDLGGTLPHGYTAHPKLDPATGLLHAVSYHWALPHLEYTVIDADGAVQHVSPVPVDDGPMVHDCSITERWVVVYDLPVTFDLDAAMGGGTFPYTWKDDRPARLGLIPLGGDGADVRWFEVNPCYVFHPLNAHDDGDKVILDVVRYDRMFDAKRNGPDDSAPMLWRWTVDTTAGTVHEEQLSDRSFEFPRIDERLVGRPHRWGYGATVRHDGGAKDNAFGGELVRIDGKTGDVATVDLGAGRAAGEWSMVPRHADAAEDDGWLVSFGYDKETDRGELVVLPAADPAAGPVARVILPNRIPVGFHGNWVAD